MLRPALLPFIAFSLLGACTHGVEKNLEPVLVEAKTTVAPPRESPLLLHKIAFGSCNRQNLPQPMWRKILEEKPELWIWMGDAIYADTQDMGIMSRKYNQQLNQPEYAGFLATGTPIIGTYDDHDFGANDAGKEYPKKAEAKQYFLDFLNEPKDSPRRNQPGIYTSYRFGPEGKRVKVILTDTRYNRESPGAEADILGKEQWIWLEKELSTLDSELLVLVSGTQILPFEHDFEKWANFPKAREKLLGLLSASAYKNIILLSGDRHLGELSQLKLPSGKVLWEATSSGLTHSYRDYTPKRNKNSLRSGDVLARLNYGVLNIDWESSKPHVDLEVRDINKQSILKQTIELQR